MNSVQQKSEWLIQKIDYLFSNLDTLTSNMQNSYGTTDPQFQLYEHKAIAIHRLIDLYLSYLKVVTQLEMDGILGKNVNSYVT